jgi:hypothetical protein
MSVLYYFPSSFCNLIHIRTKALVPLSLDLKRLRRPYYLWRVDRVRKIRDRKQRTDIWKYSFVNRNVKKWNQLPAEELGTSACKLKIFRNRVGKAIINGVK